MMLQLGSTLLSLALCAFPASAAGQPSAPVESQVSAKSIFGEPVIVHGKRISDDEIKRFLCHSVGWQEASKFKFQVMIDQELERRRQQGVSEEQLAQLKVSDADLDRRLQHKKEDFLLRYPTLDFRAEVARANLSLEVYREQLRQEMMFDRVFRPDNPADWPELTKAIIIEGLGEQWIDDEKVSYEVRLKRQVEQNLEDLPEDDPIAVDATRSTILTALNNWAVVYLDEDAIFDALPEAGPDAPADANARAALRRERAAKTLMLVDNVPILIDDVYSRISPYVTADQIEDAKRFLVNMALMERYLGPQPAADGGEAKPGVLMTPAQFREWWPTTARNGTFQYMEFLNQHEMLSSQVLGFPSLWSFANYFRIMESYRRAIADELAKDEMLASSLPMSNQVRGAAKLSVNVLFVSAFDFDKVAWKENGWADARQRAMELKKALDDGADWKSTLELHSEWWDPPMPEMGNKPVQNFYFKGTFGDQQLTRNQLYSYLGESEYRSYLYGPSATDEIFFQQKMGTIGGPYRAPKGYYIARITGKTPPTRPLDLKEPIHRQIVEQDYLTHSLNNRVASLLRDGIESGAVKGIAPGGSFKDL